MRFHAAQSAGAQGEEVLHEGRKVARESLVGRLARFRMGKSSRDVDRTLRFLVPLAARAVPVYMNLWRDAGVDVGGFAASRDLSRLPVVGKAELLAAGLSNRLRQGTDISRCIRRGTSGTSGPPIDILFSRTEFRYRQACLLRRVWADLGSWSPLRWAEAGAWIPPDRRGQPSEAGRLVRILRIPRSVDEDEQIRELQRFRPHVISGCPSDLQLIATRLRQSSSATLRPRRVISRGEVLRDDVRTLLRQAFACPVSDYYNIQEVGNLAWRCPDHSDVMHVNADTAVLEVVDEAGRPLPPGIVGDIVATSLFNATMPFIRYRIGDRASWIDPGPRPCSCGARAASLSLIEGRKDDLLQLSSGRWVSPRVVDDLVLETMHATVDEVLFLPGIRTYQIVQSVPGRMTVRIEASRPVPLLGAVLEERLRTLDPGLDITFEFVDHIARDPSGKLRRVVSTLRPSP